MKKKEKFFRLHCRGMRSRVRKVKSAQQAKRFQKEKEAHKAAGEKILAVVDRLCRNPELISKYYPYMVLKMHKYWLVRNTISYQNVLKNWYVKEIIKAGITEEIELAWILGTPVFLQPYSKEMQVLLEMKRQGHEFSEKAKECLKQRGLSQLL